ncbi:MAG: sulfate transporter CysZ [Chromatiales bacterium 21-64-14]|nr:MAG: sulfate transporter CysZ [Chromatiales bacterium 21-64-14]HQU15334.1 sulfate transporter CysZ [Gammaproteobacteria bacterium]
MKNAGPVTGARYFLRGVGLLRHPRLRSVVILPLLINALLFAVVIGAATSEFNGWVDRLIPAWLEWLRWLLWPLFAVTVLVVVFYTFTVLANLVGAPFNILLAARVEALLGGAAPALGTGWRSLAREAARGIGSELRKLRYFTVRAIPLLLLFLVPGVNLVAPFLWLAFSAWMLTLQYADYPMGNHGILFPEQRRRMAAQPLLALGFGGLTLLATLTPVANFLAMPAAVAGATAMWVENLALPGVHTTRRAERGTPQP